MKPSTVYLRNAAIIAVADSCGMSFGDLSAVLAGLTCSQYRHTIGRMPYLRLSKEAYSILTIPAEKALNRYLARRERIGGKEGLAPASLLFLCHTSGITARAMTVEEVACVIGQPAVEKRRVA